MAPVQRSPAKGNNGLFIVEPSTEFKRPWLLIGAFGAGMRAFTEILLDAGETVVGTDHDLAVMASGHLNQVNRPGFRLLLPDRIEQIFSHCPERVVHSMAVEKSNALLQHCRSRGLRPVSLPEALAEFLKNHDQLCVGGTHGKTTTTGMTWSILDQAGGNPSVYVGGVLRNRRRSGVFGSGRQAVIESCEYRRSFLQLSPRRILLTGIEPDHFDFFLSQAECDQTYFDFVARLPSDGTLIYNQDCHRSSMIALTCGRPTVSFSLHGDADWNAVSCESKFPEESSGIQRQTFQLRNKARDAGLVKLQLPGRHNRQNALAAIAAAITSGVTVESAIRGVEEFSGIERRFEHRGKLFGIDWIDDYAHHPTAIRSTLATARSVFENRRLIAVFEPHQISRLTALFEDFRSALSLADECLILPVLPAREAASPAFCRRAAGQLVRSISDSGGRAFLMTNLDQVLGRLDDSGRPGDVVVTMGAGRTHKIHDEIHRRLQRNSAA